MKKFILTFLVLIVLSGCGYKNEANEVSHTETKPELSDVEQENQRCYDSGYEAGYEAGCHAVIESPGDYDLVKPEDIIIAIVDEGYEDFARKIWGDRVVDKVYYGIEPSYDPNLFSNSNN
ncbi:MAG: membrane lipoprotein lipid attachment site-containing protein [Oscillospiraceae bacterium]|nr:membrane lipoprotein lipid attachment site-containing protein [Oscillospiraceae bacterium]